MSHLPPGLNIDIGICDRVGSTGRVYNTSQLDQRDSLRSKRDTSSVPTPTEAKRGLFRQTEVTDPTVFYLLDDDDRYYVVESICGRYRDSFGSDDPQARVKKLLVDTRRDGAYRSYLDEWSQRGWVIDDTTGMTHGVSYGSNSIFAIFFHASGDVSTLSVPPDWRRRSLPGFLHPLAVCLNGKDFYVPNFRV